MMEALFKSGPEAFDVLAPIGADFYLYILPEGGLLTYGWKLDGPPTEGTRLAWFKDGPVAGWTEVTAESKAQWEIAKVTQYSRTNDDRDPALLEEDAVMRVSLCTLKPAENFTPSHPDPENLG